MMPTRKPPTPPDGPQRPNDDDHEEEYDGEREEREERDQRQPAQQPFQQPALPPGVELANVPTGVLAGSLTGWALVLESAAEQHERDAEDLRADRLANLTAALERDAHATQRLQATYDYLRQRGHLSREEAATLSDMGAELVRRRQQLAHWRQALLDTQTAIRQHEEAAQQLREQARQARQQADQPPSDDA